jgi:hypothetical protein
MKRWVGLGVIADNGKAVTHVARSLPKPFKEDRRQPGGLCLAKAIDRASKNINLAPESS